MHGAYDWQWKAQEFGDEVVGADGILDLPRNLRFASERAVPWWRSSFDEDFILVAEFSENEGPRPVVSDPYHVADDLSLIFPYRKVHRGRSKLPQTKCSAVF